MYMYMYIVYVSVFFSVPKAPINPTSIQYRRNGCRIVLIESCTHDQVFYAKLHEPCTGYKMVNLSPLIQILQWGTQGGAFLRVLEHPHQPDFPTNVFFLLECPRVLICAEPF